MTDLDNLTLVSPAMHAQVDDSRTDENRWWTRVARRDSGRRVDWIPPVTESSDREPQHNDHPTVWRNPGNALRREVRDALDDDAPDHDNPDRDIPAPPTQTRTTRTTTARTTAVQTMSPETDG